MLRFPPASMPWLLTHELKLLFSSTAKGTKIVLLVGLCFVLMVTATAGVPLALYLETRPLAPTPLFILIADGAVVVLFTLILSQTLSMATQAFFDRGDLDLLLSSPLRPSHVLFVRCLAIALSPIVLYLVLLTPFVLPLALLGHWPLLAAYGVMVALGLTSATVGLLLATALFSLIGPRRTKTVGQILAAFVGAMAFLASQAVNFLPDHGRSLAVKLHGLVAMGYFGPHAALSWPARAVLGDPVPFLGFFTCSALFFFGVVNSVGARFAVDASISFGVTSASSPRRDASPVRGFLGGVRRSLVRKELRLIARDPALLSQVLLRILYFIPLAFVLLRNARLGNEMTVVGSAGAIVFFASQIAGSLAWITISAEDAPDLLLSAPVSPMRVRAAKLLAAFMPVVALSAWPVAGLVWFRPWAGVASGLGVTAASLSAGLINLWYEKPQPRKNFRRRIGGSLVATLGDLFVGISWAVTTGFAASGSLWALTVAVLPLGVMGALSVGRRRDFGPDSAPD
ncbi:MAG: hypothetical protein KGL29_09250 [Alphaproteobacteria bacterium]|nr:hypothetical protein [Alphaproteobacteria bacterium]MDE2266072.1 hypothetical protein [Alphaproteobacteria bacterium]MDE2500155.1 hypothetical protein [Alphaproteobacteria bacterium]